MSEILKLPEPKQSEKRSCRALTSCKTVCITEDKVLEELKQKEIDKKNTEEEKATKQLAKVRKQKEKQEKAAAKAAGKARKDQQQKVLKKNTSISCKDTEDLSTDDTACPLCGLVFLSDDTGDFWVCCDSCDQWFDRKCTTIRSCKKIPDSFICEICTKRK